MRLNLKDSHQNLMRFSIYFSENFREIIEILIIVNLVFYFENKVRIFLYSLIILFKYFIVKLMSKRKDRTFFFVFRFFFFLLQAISTSAISKDLDANQDQISGKSIFFAFKISAETQPRRRYGSSSEIWWLMMIFKRYYRTYFWEISRRTFLF